MVQPIHKTLKAHEFAVNPYGRCIVNIIIDRNQCTVYWYFDDNKLLHFDEEVNTKIIDTTSKHVDELTVQEVKTQNTVNG